MAPLEVPTDLGPIWFWGADTGQPAILLITGLFAEPGQWELDVSLLPPGFDYLRAHLPGNHCPAIAELSVEALGRAFSQAIATRFEGRPVLVAGFSVGALVALSVRAPNVGRLFLVEPPLRTHDLWPVVDWASGPLSDDQRTLLFNTLGVGAEGLTQRDHTGLLARLDKPAEVILGAVPLLPPRRLDALPSLVDEPSRALLATHPLIRTAVVEGAGHNVSGDAAMTVLRALMASARQAFFAPGGR
ncbi:MAG: alpha/beta hydrolase [Phenylobacterium sp.]|nr:MAG: alpha/beta hydrolase [Phenylobacterium sp.]